jgi:hypothetical protein
MAPPALSLTSRVVASANYVSTKVGGETVILGMRDGVYYGLNPVGTRIWDLVRQPRVLGDVADTLTAEFEVTREQATADLLALAQDLATRGLIEVLPA